MEMRKGSSTGITSWINISLGSWWLQMEFAEQIGWEKAVGGCDSWNFGRGHCWLIMLGQEVLFILFNTWPISAKSSSTQNANWRGMHYFPWIRFNLNLIDKALWFSGQDLQTAFAISVWSLTSASYYEWAHVNARLTSVLVQPWQTFLTFNISDP